MRFSPQKLTVAREAVGLSKAEVGRRIGVRDLAVYRWEAGKSVPDVNRLGRLAELYGVDVNSFYDTRDSRCQTT